MKNTEREQIASDFITKSILKSWTYERLTKEERERLQESFGRVKLYGNNKKQICEEINAIYYAFLMALNYNWNDWREPGKEINF